jgi:dolichol-phosphate mannosyltransferase
MTATKEKNFISAIVYVYNSEDTIGEFLKKLYDVLQMNFEKFEIICANDASTDRSVEAIRSQSSSMHNCVLSIVNMGFYQGLESAMNAAIDLSIGDFVFEFDTNYVDYDPKLITDVYFKSLSGYDIVAASNTKSRLVSSIFYKIYNSNSGAQYRIVSETFRILSRRAINRVHSMSITLPYRKALYSNCGLKVYTLSYTSTSGLKHSRASEHLKSNQETALNTLILFTDVAYKVSIWFTVLMMLATVVIGIYVLTVFIMQQPVPGFTPIMLVMTGSFFGVFAILAIVIKYLSVLVSLVFKRQKYIIESIDKVL